MTKILTLKKPRRPRNPAVAEATADWRKVNTGCAVEDRLVAIAQKALDKGLDYHATDDPILCGHIDGLIEDIINWHGLEPRQTEEERA
jgi:hypothetical protein